MNPKALTKLYDHLRAGERLALLVAASVHGDAVERQRLLDSAPLEHVAMHHHHARATALSEAATLHLLTLLDVAASYWQWWGLWGWRELKNQRQTAPDHAGADNTNAPEDEQTQVLRIVGMVRYQAFLFVTHREGWRQFCRQWPLDADALLQIQPGWDMVVRTETPAREHAYTLDEAALFLLSQTPVPEGPEAEPVELPELLTVEGLAQVWHTVIEQHMQSP